MKKKIDLLSVATTTAAATIILLSSFCNLSSVKGLGVNWGTQCSHPMDPHIIIRMLIDNGFQKVKLFDADYSALHALGKSGIEVMVGIPNDMLISLASNMKSAEKWVSQNVSDHISSHNVNIRYVAVGNEPFLETYNGTYLNTTFPALQNIQSALIKAGLGSKVKVTVPLNADVYTSSTNVPSGGDFRASIHGYMMQIIKFLSDNDGVFTVNIYPFISLYSDPNFPVEYAFFDSGSGVTPLNDGGTEYYNMFDANYDTLVWALKRNGYGNLPVVVGEIGWPTDGDLNANLEYARRFNQGFVSRVSGGKGTPMRPGPIEVYMFSLVDEDQKSIQPGNFERHWGLFTFDGLPKYQLNLKGITGNQTVGSSGLIGAKGVKYLDKKWCVLKDGVKLTDQKVGDSVSYACGLADCTSLGYGTSCGSLDAKGNVSYAFNSYYQVNNQEDVACKFGGLGIVTTSDPSTGTCRFIVQIEPLLSAAEKSMVRLRLLFGGVLFGLIYSIVVLF